MTDVNKMISRREKQIKKAKKKSISATMDGGLKEYLISWLIEHQQGIHRHTYNTSMQMYLITAMDYLWEVVSMVDPRAHIELMWKGDDSSMETLNLDGVKVTWSAEVATKRGENQLLVDSSTLLLREIGVE